MKRILCLCCVMVLLAGCETPDKNFSRILQFREKLLQSNKCTFQADIAADYGQNVYHFSMECDADREGNLHFTVIEPESIADITGEVLENGGRLTFDDTVLGFPLLADGMLAPVSAPWVLLNALRSGYIHSYCKTEEGICVTVNDSYDEDALLLEVWFDDALIPYHAEIMWREQRVLSLKLENFIIL